MAQRVLVVDDDRDICEVIVSLLVEEGYQAECAANGREALLQLRARPAPDVILLDLMMPVMDGWEFLAERERDPALSSIPVVVLTASGRRPLPGDRVARVLSKPLSAEQLLEAVERVA